MWKILSTVLLLTLATDAYAEAFSKPTLMSGDTWAYHLSIQKGGTLRESHVTISVTRVGSDSVLVTQKDSANPTQLQSMMFGLDWSKRRSVNGQETTVNQPLSYPLKVGKTWEVEYTELNPNPQKLRETDTMPYKVVGWEDITVPAGKFHALKIESNGRWAADLTPRIVNNALITRQGAVAAETTENRIVQGVRVSGRYYKCFWYVPEVKRWVKSTEENYAANGSLSLAVTDELESFNLNGADKSKPSESPAESQPSPAESTAPVVQPSSPAKDAI